MKNFVIFFSFLLLAFSIELLNAQTPKTLNEFDKKFLKSNNTQQKSENSTLKYKNNSEDDKLTSFCDEAGFENSTTLNWNIWHGYYGKGSPPNQGFSGGFDCSNTSSNNMANQNWVQGLIQSGNTTFEYYNLNTSMSPCPPALTSIPNTDLQVHHQVQSAGNDPLLGAILPKTHSGNRSARLGNAVWNNGIEKLEKRFVVTSSTQKIGFYYAVVMGNPCLGPISPTCTSPHTGINTITSFIVQIKDETNISNPYYLNNLVNLGNGNNFITNTDQILTKTLAYTNPCTPNVNPTVGNEIAYKPWSYVQINLPNSLLGKTVNIEFITRDCAHTGHFCYAYLDDFCSEPDIANPSGSAALGSSDSCGLKGKICVNYSLPKTGTTTGTVKFTLNTITGGGTVMNIPISSPVLTAGSSYCFDISNLGTINPPAFDYYITADYTLSGGSLPQQIIGSTVSGVKLGLDNDYKINCTPNIAFDPCCPPMDSALIKTLFKFDPTGAISDPYRVTFAPTAFFKATSQAYVDYIHILYPNITKLTYSWELFKAGTGVTPIVSYQSVDNLETRYNWFVPGGASNIGGQTTLFTPLLSATTNQWYRIHVGIFTEPASNAFKAAECSANTNYFFRIQVTNGARKVSISNGKKIISEFLLNPKK